MAIFDARSTGTPGLSMLDTLKTQTSELEVARAIEASVELMAAFAVPGDHREWYDDLAEGYTDLAQYGYAGDLRPEISVQYATTERVEQLAKAELPYAVIASHPWRPPFWYPTPEQDRAMPRGYEPRLTLHTHQSDGYDPSLHFRGTPYDNMDGTSALDSAGWVTMEFPAAHAGSFVRLIDRRGFLLQRLMNHIMGKPDFGVGRMRMRARSKSSLGDVLSVGRTVAPMMPISFGYERGHADSACGVGLEVGLR